RDLEPSCLVSVSQHGLASLSPAAARKTRKRRERDFHGRRDCSLGRSPLTMSLYSQEERSLRQLLDHVSDAVVATDTHGRVTFANPAAQKLYGIAEDDAIGRGL